ncbi:hypothetical protein ASJ81_19050 [Methanosarcina spelaei]|uniref:Nucleoside phosphorylase domain-containing protein n=1 Tax=Methanosarcina spelaei TaxID=1036679 RepID=A0A2A2HUM9_9EURY|nr:hypothetical protein [Methanosarcina spelaei]PAV13015.1 hypothetical protein ASJ81_19050 [Methanosarcina spelaei]
MELIDEKIEQFQHILNNATYDTRYNTEYHEAYYGTETLVTELFSEEDAKKFRWNVSNLVLVATMHIDYETELKDYKNHINKCISQLKVYKERIRNFWEAPEPLEHEVNETISQETNIKADILLVTATKTESRAIIDIFQDITNQTSQLSLIGDRIYHDIGSVNGMRIFMVQSEMGSGGLGSSQQTVQKGIIDLAPEEVIMVGIAFGIDPKKQSIGDVLVSKQLMLYELQRVGTKDGNPKLIPRGDKVHSSTKLLNYFRSADLSWDESKCKVSFGLILSGEKLVDNIDFRQQLCDLDPEAIGGEMEGAGMYVACHDSRIDWILVKSICDWADGNKSHNKENQQKLAAKNAASFVLYMLQLVPFAGKLKVCESVSDMESLLIERSLVESNHKPVIGELRKITPEPQSSKIHETFTSLSNEKIENSEDENHFKRENAEKIIEKVVRPLRDCAKYIKPYFENGDYILNLENKTVSLNLKFDGYEFFQICEKSNRFCLKDENLVFTYKRDEILNRSMSRITSHLDYYREHFIALKTAIENLNTSNVPISFESDIAVLIENESKKYALAEDERKEEFLFKLYATVVTGKDAFSGHDWATTLKKTKSKEVLEIIKKDPYSNETFTKIEYLKNEIILNIDKLINELNSLDEELQNAYCL